MDKNYTKTGRSCRVTFDAPAQISAQSMALCGEFNAWDPEKNPMKKRKDGSYHTTISLKPGHSYRFRYLVDGERWENDWAADAYVPNDFGTEDSIVSI